MDREQINRYYRASIMKSGKYTLRELFLNKNIEQIIVPEIQRDYVWKAEQVISILNSITSDYEKFLINDDLKSLDTIDDKIIKKMFEQYYKKQKYSSNIGFIYAYNDSEFKDKYFLIDGQQRLTTMYLLIFAIYNLLDKKDDFVKYYFYQNTLKLDYKVRDSSHDFLIDFITNVSKNFDMEKLENQYWYFSKYDSDATISSIKENYKIIVNYFTDIDNLQDFKEYIENYIEFWFFDTNISKQGEELYLSMNSRGEAMQSNENLKALLLKDLDLDSRGASGKEWEEWQHFFWLNRGSSENADKGFNEFIRWIIIIEVFSIESTNTDKMKEEKLKNILETENFVHYIEYLSIDIIKGYIISIKKLFDMNLIENHIPTGENKTIIHLIELLPLFKIAYKESSFDLIDYLRYKNFFKNIMRFVDIAKNPDTYIIRTIELMSSYEKIPKDIIELRNNDKKEFSNIINNDEKVKMTILSKTTSNRKKIEKSFWEIEEHGLLKGNLSFLLNLIDKNNFELDKFEKFKSLFSQIFKDKVPNKVRQALLVYNDYCIHDGWTYHKERYSFEITWKEWNSKNSEMLHECSKNLLISLSHMDNDSLSIDDKLDDIINGFDKSDDWRYYFIRDSTIFKYAKKSKITWDNDTDKPYLILEQNNGNNGSELFSSFVEKINNDLI